MSIKRPEELSPAMGSIISSYIPSSGYLMWRHRGGEKETGATIRVKSEDGTLLESFSSTIGYLEMAEFAHLLVNGNRYKWDVQTISSEGTSPWSEEAIFLYDEVSVSSSFVWSVTPEKDEQVSRNQVFQELKDAVVSIANDYVGSGVEDESSYIQMAEELFTGDIIPSRQDFENLKKILNWLGQSKENEGTVAIEEWLGDGLGVTDILRIRAFLDALSAEPPNTPKGVSITVTPPTMPEVINLSGYVTGVGDKDVTVSWETEPLGEWTGSFRLTNPSTSEDVSYYHVLFQYGNETETYTHPLYFEKTALESGILFNKDWSDLFEANGKARFTLYIRAIDKRGNASNFSTWTKVYSQNAPMGIAGIELQWNKENESSWPWVFGSSALVGTTRKHYIGGQNFKMRYRARTVDVSGLKGSWYVSSDVNFRGLIPPGVPRNIKWTSTQSTINLTWDAGLYADGYEIRIRTGSAGAWSSWLAKSETNREHENTGRTKDTEYHYEIRSTNDIGKSSAVLVKTRTKKPSEVTVNFTASRNGQSWRTDYKSYYSMVKGGWRTDTTDVIQGRWEYIQNTWDDWDMDGKKDDWVLKGMHNGNHRGLWFFDYNQIRSKLNGKRIKSAYIYVRRKESEHGWPKDATPIYLWTHNYSYPPAGVPQLGSSTNTRVKLDRGEAKWVPVPVSFVQRIVDGTAKGLAVYKQNVGVQYDLSYQRFYSQASLRVTYYND